MESIVRDIRLGGRMLRKTPAATLISVLALAAGIGLSAMMFSILYGAILRGLPFPDSDRIMSLERANLPAGNTNMMVPIHDFEDWRAQQRSFEHLTALSTGTVNIAGGDRPERYNGAFTTPSMFAMLRAQPLIGRSFTEEESLPGAPNVIVLGYHVWRDAFGSDPNVLGRTVRANGEETTIIGVMPDGFRFPVTQDVWLPLRRAASETQRGQGGWLRVVGRLREGVNIEQAAAEFDRITQRLAVDYPQTNENISAVITPFIREVLGDEAPALLFTMLGAVLLVLLMACTNVANLLMSRTALRIKEVAIRSALGAGKLRVAMQFLAEAFVLALCAAGVGILIAWVGVRLFNNAIAGTNPPFWIDIRIDGPALLLVLLLTILATLASGALPAFQAARANINDILKDESRGSSSFRIGRVSRGLVVFDIALSFSLLVGAGLMTKSIVKLGNIDLTFPTADIFTARIGLPELNYPDTVSQIRFFENLLPRLQSMAGVTAVSLTSAVPALGSGSSNLAVEGVTYAEARDFPSARRATITPGFFGTFNQPVLDGRDFTQGDREGSQPVAIVNASFARRHFEGESAVGRRIRLGGPDSEQPWLSIVGVVPDMYMQGVGNSGESQDGVYTPLAQNPTRFMSIVARTAASPLAMTNAFREAVAGADADLPLYFVNALDLQIAEQGWFYRVFGTLFMLFGLVALLLAGVGLYGVMSFSVGQRTREVGVRMALGARGRDVLAMIMRQGAVQLAIGLALGLVLALLVSRLITTVLFDVSPRDPFVFAAIVVVLAASTALACFIPALRATRVQPVDALRYE